MELQLFFILFKFYYKFNCKIYVLCCIIAKRQRFKLKKCEDTIELGHCICVRKNLILTEKRTKDD